MTRHTHTERAQLLLITALALAVILVTVALLLNAAIFTENTATRDTTADGHEAIELRGELVDSVGELIERENRQDQTHDELSKNISSSLDEIGPMVDRERALSGEIATLRHDASENGTLLRWHDNGSHRAFNDSGANWTLVEGFDNARAFVMTVDPETLNESTTESSDQAFGVRFTSSTDDDVTLHIYNDTDVDDEVAVSRVVEDGTPQRQCRIEYDGPSDNVTVDITGDQLSTDGSVVECLRELWPDNNPDTVEFVNIDQEVGTASVTIDSDNSGTGSVDTMDAIYSVTVDIGYRSQDLVFETTARIAPGEPR